jgi:hypothetical protein
MAGHIDIVEQLLAAKGVLHETSRFLMRKTDRQEALLSEAAMLGFAADIIAELREVIRAHVPEAVARKALSAAEAAAIFGKGE